MFGFEKLDVWQVAIEFADEIYRTTQRFPSDERFGLTSQLRRSAVSIAANVAEGGWQKFEARVHPVPGRVLWIIDGSCFPPANCPASEVLIGYRASTAIRIRGSVGSSVEPAQKQPRTAMNHYLNAKRSTLNATSSERC